jgi:iron complex outermembrane receptor protein
MFRVAPAMAGETGTENRPPKFDRVVTGQITQGGAPLTGATVSVKGTSTSVNTDANGNFSISVPDDKAVLVISYVGFTTQEIVVGARSNINVGLQSSSTDLANIVVMGYGTQSRCRKNH